MRSLIFNLFFYLTTIIYILSCLFASLIPGRKALMAALKRYTKLMMWGMRRIGGMDIQIIGKEHIPAEGPVIIAAKHQSYGDGFAIFSSFEDLSFVTGDHLQKYWGLKRILTKMNAVVIDSCGGSDSRKKMEAQAETVRNEGRRLDFMELLQDRIESRSIELLDLDNPGALDPANIGRLEENSVAPRGSNQTSAAFTLAPLCPALCLVRSWNL